MPLMDMESGQIWDQKAGSPQGRSQGKENVWVQRDWEVTWEQFNSEGSGFKVFKPDWLH